MILAAVLLAVLAPPDEAPPSPAAPAPLATPFAAGVDPAAPWPEHPRPQFARGAWANLNGAWQCVFPAAGEAPPFGRELDEEVLVPFPIGSALSRQPRLVERVDYRRTFDVPAEWRIGVDGRRLLLHFGAVDHACEVFVDGTRVGTHEGGYDAFGFDVTGELRGDGPHELIVRVFDPSDGGAQPRGKQVRAPGGIWYTASTGIWQTVWLEPVPAAHLARARLLPDLESAALALDVEVAGAIPAGARLVAEVVADGEFVATAEADAAARTRLETEIPEARAWSPEDPYLYSLRLTLVDAEGALLDLVGSYFGLRSVSIDTAEGGRPRIRINGEARFLPGVLDQGFWPESLHAAPSDEALRFDVATVKQLGFVLARKHVKVEPQRWYHWCDRLGLLVMQDMPSGGPFIGPQDADAEPPPADRARFERELRAMVEGLGNHPSVVHWVVFNEGWGQHDTARLARLVKEWDPTRLVTAASGWTDRGVGDAFDVHAYPGPVRVEAQGARAAVLGEFGGFGLPIEGHVHSATSWGYQNLGSREELATRYAAVWSEVLSFAREDGMSAAIYTQLTDVETECNGLVTYDRRVVKIDPQAARRAIGAE